MGGKLLTNLLTEYISFKDVNLTGETLLVNDIKEQLCYVSLDFERELKELTHDKQSPLLKEYVLPDFSKQSFKGHIRDPSKDLSHDEQTIKMGNSWINVPEVLFNPSDIGIDQAGLPEMILQCVSKTNPSLHSLLLNNIVLTGGNTLFPNFREWLQKEMQMLWPTEFDHLEMKIWQL